MNGIDDPACDPAVLQQTLIEAASIIATLSADLSTAQQERDVAVAQRDAALQEHAKLLLILSQYRRALFGRRSERLDETQLELMLAKTAVAPVVANENTPETSEEAAAGTSSASRQPRRNRGRLPLELPRIEVVVDVEDKTCPCCGGALHKIGESVKERLDVVPVPYRVKRIIRPRYGCRACEGAVVQAPAPPQAVDVAHPTGHGLPAERDAVAGVNLLLAVQWLAVGIFGDRDLGEQPLGRQAALD
jgi:hypothetical protein